MITITGRFFRSCTGARQRPELSLPGFLYAQGGFGAAHHCRSHRFFYCSHLNKRDDERFLQCILLLPPAIPNQFSRDISTAPAFFLLVLIME